MTPLNRPSEPRVETVEDPGEPTSTPALVLVLLVLAAAFVGLALGRAMASESATSIPAELRIALVRAPGVEAVRVGQDGRDLAAVVVAFLSDNGLADFEADDFIITKTVDKLILTPIRAGLWCTTSKSLAFDAAGGAALLDALRRADRGRA